MDLAASEFAMLGEDFSRVANVNITTDQLCDINLIFLLFSLLLSACLSCSCFWFSSFLLLAGLLTLAIRRRRLTEQSDLLGIDLSKDFCAICPSQLLVSFCEQQSEIKVVFLFFDCRCILCKQRVNSLLNLLFGNDYSDTGFCVKLGNIKLVIFAYRLKFAIDKLDSLSDLVRSGPFAIGNLLCQGLSIVRMVWLKLVSECSVEGSLFFGTFADTCQVKNIYQRSCRFLVLE